ncbi:MAG: class I SAM-dependent RNA methyltransferase, partial [Candidatus Eremiobacteraeota bacterium]|nr:class I SAM-dependent RNA methyltransferase [Candidatus Eremiobacteraeota bacterium]
MLATCSFGLEAVLARELTDLGMQDISSDNGQVAFSGGPEELARANMWLRTADRVWIKLADFPASTFEQLFEGTKAIEWGDYLPRDAEFPVTGFSVKSQLSSVPACQKIVKKASVEK